MNYKSWLEEYYEEICILYNNLITVLKRKKILYKEYNFDTFCKLIYKKSSKN
jgi:hypothetical protein